MTSLKFYAAIAFAAILAFLGVRWKFKNEGKEEERQRQQQEILDAAKERDKIERDSEQLNDEQLRDRLRPPS